MEAVDGPSITLKLVENEGVDGAYQYDDDWNLESTNNEVNNQEKKSSLRKKLKSKKTESKPELKAPALWRNSSLKKIRENISRRLNSRSLSHRDHVATVSADHEKSGRRRSSSLDSLRDYVGNVDLEALREEHQRRSRLDELEIIETSLESFIKQKSECNRAVSGINTKLELYWHLLIEKVEKGVGSKRNGPISSVLRRLKVLKEFAKNRMKDLEGNEWGTFNWK